MNIDDFKNIIEPVINRNNCLLWGIEILRGKKKNTLRIDLWTKEMKTDEMKRFYIGCLGGLSQSILSSTGDEYMSKETNKLCDKLIEHIKNNPN